MPEQQNVFAVYAGAEPPEWGKAGYRRMKDQFGDHRYLFLAEPERIHNRVTGAYEIPPGWQETMDDARSHGYEVREISRDVVPDAAAVMAAVGTRTTEEDLRRFISVQMLHGNQIAAKDLTFFMAPTAYGGFPLDLSVELREDARRSVRLGDLTLRRRGLDKDLHIDPKYGIKMPFDPKSFTTHIPGLDTHDMWEHRGPGHVELKGLENFALGGDGPGPRGEVSVGQEYWARVTDRYVGYFMAALERDGITLGRGGTLSPMPAPGSTTAQWLTPDHPRRREHIGQSALRAMNDVALEMFGKDGKLHRDFYKKVGLQIRDVPEDSARKNAGEALQKTYLNSWDLAKPHSVNPAGRITKMDVAGTASWPPPAHAADPQRSPMLPAGRQYSQGVYTNPEAQQSTRSSPTQSVDGNTSSREGSPGRRSDGDSPTNTAPLAPAPWSPSRGLTAAARDGEGSARAAGATLPPAYRAQQEKPQQSQSTRR